MGVKKCKCRVVHLRRNNCLHQYRLGDDLMERSCAEKNLVVLVNNMLAMSHSPWLMNVVHLINVYKYLKGSEDKWMKPGSSWWSVTIGQGIMT